MDSPEICLLLFRVLINLLFLKCQISRLLLKLLLLLLDHLLEVLNFLRVLRHSLLQLHITSAILKINIGLECLDAGLDRVKGDFLNENLLRESN